MLRSQAKPLVAAIGVSVGVVATSALLAVALPAAGRGPERHSDFAVYTLGLILTRRIIEQIGLCDTTWHSPDLQYAWRLIARRANFVYAHIKLYRDGIYAHSGQTKDALVNRDPLRVLLEHAWIGIEEYPPTVLAEALGLSDSHRGRQMANMVWAAAVLRRVRLPYLAVASRSAAVLHLYHRLRDRMRTVIGLGPVTSAPPSDAMPVIELIEPDWDGSLR